MENFYHLTKNGKKLYILILDNENIKAFIYFNQYLPGKWESPTAAASEKGWGWKLHEMGMSRIHPDWFTPFREKNIQPHVQELYKRIIMRDDIMLQKINEDEIDFVPVSKENDPWFNMRYKLRKKPHYEFTEDKKGWIKHEGLKFFNTLYDINIKTLDL